MTGDVLIRGWGEEEQKLHNCTCHSVEFICSRGRKKSVEKIIIIQLNVKIHV